MIALITDFGLADPYAGQMKGAILAGAPEARVVDVSHLVEPYNVAQAGYFLAASLGLFPRGTVFVAVVDPGVGGSRRIVGAQKRGRILLAPDNGLLGQALCGPGAAQVYDLTPEPGSPASATFHGRDVFAPLAALLESGEKLASLGAPIDPASLETLPQATASKSGGVWTARVVHIDRFGNCVLNISADARLPEAGWARLLAPAARPLDLAASYASLATGRIGLLRGSQGFYELALNMGSAAAALGLRLGDAVELSLPGETAAP
jgi:S-adenosyl-L-methionine hydrolase (adenosine-forming)